MSSAEASLAFFRQLQLLTNQIHAAPDLGAALAPISEGLCRLFACDRLTVYQLSPERDSMVSMVKTGLAAFKHLKLPVSRHSIAGYAVLAARMVNLRDVYDTAELHAIDPALCHLHGVDRRTGYRARQMLVIPVADPGGVVLGALQLINNHNGGAFDALVQEGGQHVADALAIAMLRAPAVPAATPAPAVAGAVAQLERLARASGLSGVHITTTGQDDGAVHVTITGTLRPGA